MKVLLTLPDLYLWIGGGQSVYRTIIQSSPDIEFWYPRAAEPEDAPRPSNAKAFPLLSHRALTLNAPPPHPAYELRALEQADAIARSVAGHSFDIVEIPDFLTFGGALRAACSRHNIKVGRFVVSMHGNISKSIDMNWGSAGDRVLEYQILERTQYWYADGVYGISHRYIREWQNVLDREVYYIDPLNFVCVSLPKGSWKEPSDKPSLYCIGRSERRKGNDLFIEFLRWLKPQSFEKAEHIGGMDFSNGTSSAHYLKNIAEVRGIAVPYRGEFSQLELESLYKSAAISVLPVRYDSLNLVALEALLSGCPIAVSTRAGICDYLDEVHPQLPYLKLDLSNLYENVSALQELIDNYHDRRRALHAALLRNPPRPGARLQMAALYRTILDAPPRRNDVACKPLMASSFGTPEFFTIPQKEIAKNGAVGQPYKEAPLSLGRNVQNFVSRIIPHKTKNILRPLVCARGNYIKNRLRQSKYFLVARQLSMLRDTHYVPRRLSAIGHQRENNEDALSEKLRTLYRYDSTTLFRCNFWRDIARIERLRGHDLLAATYELRILRLLGHDALHLLPLLTETLNANAFCSEAEAVTALYSDPAAGPERVYDLLNARFERLRHYEAKPWAILDDRRAEGPRVAVIVSLYGAAEKLRFFLTALAQQTLARRGEVEIILVDSGSPTDEKGVFEAFHKEHALSMIYARSPTRETIQAAWNRGIKLARAQYIACLGVDETLYPEGLEVLADELDHYPEVDWVMGHSLVTAVEEDGLYKNDIMSYDRSGATKDHVYLETCYLSWVGGMYRRSIHDRFGYYDETFRGAGDTEFKNRVLPHINVHFVDRMLGLFLNYPEGQTTASPMAEIEDSRAWYLFRSLAGLRYAFEGRPIEDAEALLRLCLGYRKSYCKHVSTDIEYGTLLSEYILSRKPESKIANQVAPGLHDLLRCMRRLEFAWEQPSHLNALGPVIGTWHSATRWQNRHRVTLGKHGEKQIRYDIFNDNRYEQHSWLWKSL